MDPIFSSTKTLESSRHWFLPILWAASLVFMPPEASKIYSNCVSLASWAAWDREKDIKVDKNATKRPLLDTLTTMVNPLLGQSHEMFDPSKFAQKEALRVPGRRRRDVLSHDPAGSASQALFYGEVR